MSAPREIDVYRVGFLSALHTDWRTLIIAHRKPWRTKVEVRSLYKHLRDRKWRDAKNQFNGWLAEHQYAGTRCGHGWTRRRAVADLHRHLEEWNREREAAR